MPSNRDDPNHTAIRLVARFLHESGYNDTLAAFKREASEQFPSLNLSTAALTKRDEPELRAVAEDWLERQLGRLSLSQSDPLQNDLDRLGWTATIPEKPRIAIRDTTNVLTVRHSVLPRRVWDSTENRFRSSQTRCFITSSVDRCLKLYDQLTYELLDSHQLPSPVLWTAVHPNHPRFVSAATMEGTVIVLDLTTRERIFESKNHSKYVVRCVWSPDGRWLATIGHDKQVHVYEVTETAPDPATIPAVLEGEEPDDLATSPSLAFSHRHILITKTNPEAAIFLPDSSSLIYSARDDNILHELKMPTESAPDEWKLSGYNLNENGDAWISFSVLNITLHPHLPILALQTSTENARILLYPFRSNQRLATIHTTADQSEYSTPRHAWLPDGSGLVTTSEDGVIRVVDLQDAVRGRIGAHGAAAPIEDDDSATTNDELRTERARLRRAQDRGSSVIKDVLAYHGEDGKLVIVSCGFDKTVKVAV